jgi:hypothetical protein
MTWLLDPYKHKHDGRSYNNRIGTPYYGDKLRRVLAPEPTDPSLMRRAFDWYDDAPNFGPVAVACVVITIFLAALIVTGIAGDLVRWMAS